MHGAAKKAAGARNQLISSTNLERSFEEYSNERLQDIINEFRSELPDIERLLLEMKPTKKERTAAESYLFSNDKLSKKIYRNCIIAFPVTGRPLVNVKFMCCMISVIRLTLSRPERRARTAPSIEDISIVVASLRVNLQISVSIGRSIQRTDGHFNHKTSTT
jgi:hypothetical protein